MNSEVSKSLREYDYNNFEKLNEIGRGAFGRVYRCRDKKTSSYFALKRLYVKEKQLLVDFENEVKLLVGLDDGSKLVTFYGSRKHANYVDIFLEYAPNGTLTDYITKCGPIPEHEAAKFTIQILEGIKYLHDRNVIHRDIKPSNVLLFEENDIKLTDFGFSKFVESVASLSAHSFRGTVRYMAPELLNGQDYNNLVDIWSVGVTLVEMVDGKPVFSDMNDPQFIGHVKRAGKIEIKPVTDVSASLRYFLSLTFIQSPVSRPTCADLLKTTFILNCSLNSII